MTQSSGQAFRILVVDDDETFRRTIQLHLQRHRYTVAVAADGREALNLAQNFAYDVALVDILMPGMDGIDLMRELKALRPDSEAVILTGHGTVDSAVRALKLGAFDYLMKPCKLARLEHTLVNAYQKASLARDNQSLRDSLKISISDFSLVGKSPVMARVRELIRRVAPSSSNVLIDGESGTGKELVARALFRYSTRHDKPFVVVNCAALPQALLESELFGHEQGAFTGATREKRGMFEVADGGTVFVDEIAEMNPETQAKLLRVIEQGEFNRLGSTRQRHVDVRIVAATNRDLQKELSEGRFRNDLYYRLNVVRITLPPLRERKEDVPLLARHFLKRVRAAYRGPKEFSPEALGVMAGYRWPGNVRELSNIVERIAVLSDNPVITAEEISVQLGDGVFIPESDADPPTLEDIQRTHVQRVLARTGGNRSRAARILGIDRRKLYRLMERYKLEGFGRKGKGP